MYKNSSMCAYTMWSVGEQHLLLSLRLKRHFHHFIQLPYHIFSNFIFLVFCFWYSSSIFIKTNHHFLFMIKKELKMSAGSVINFISMIHINLSLRTKSSFPDLSSQWVNFIYFLGNQLFPKVFSISILSFCAIHWTQHQISSKWKYIFLTRLDLKLNDPKQLAKEDWRSHVHAEPTRIENNWDLCKIKQI